MSVHIFRGGKFKPQYGGRLISNNLGSPNVFYPNNQMGYGIGGVLRPLGRKLITTLKAPAKKAAMVLGRIIKKQGKKAAKEIIAGALSGKFKKGNRKQAIKQITTANLRQAKKEITKQVIKNLNIPSKTSMPKNSMKRKGKIANQNLYLKKDEKIFLINSLIVC